MPTWAQRRNDAASTARSCPKTRAPSSRTRRGNSVPICSGAGEGFCFGAAFGAGDGSNAGDDAADAKFFTINTELEAYSASAERYRITLTNGEETLHPRALIRYDELGSTEAMAVPIGQGELGGDPDLILFSAMRALERITLAGASIAIPSFRRIFRLTYLL